MSFGRTLRALLARADRRALRAEARFFDSYGRGGWRTPRDLVIPVDYFVRARVRSILRAWLRGERPLDVDALRDEWRDALPPGAARDERLFFKNLADFVALAGAGAPSPPRRRARARVVRVARARGVVVRAAARVAGVSGARPPWRSNSDPEDDASCSSRPASASATAAATRRRCRRACASCT